MVYRIYVEKKDGFASEAANLKADIITELGITALRNVRVINRYDVENVTRELFEYATNTVFSEPQTDSIYEAFEAELSDHVFAVEYLPGQFDQRADSAAQCIQIISAGDRPNIKSAKVYILSGKLSEEEIRSIKKYIINPVESREAVLDEYKTLAGEYTSPADVEVIDGFIDMDRTQLSDFVCRLGLAMDIDDAVFCRDYFKKENRNPTITEIKMIDTYWSDHCRHTTFLTTIDSIDFEDEALAAEYDKYKEMRRELGRENKPVCLMDIATVATRYLKAKGALPSLDESEEVNACTVKFSVEIDGKAEPWLLLFKNETHNHPTEIEPFGGAATCIGGAIRDPLSGRSYVYAAMRVTGAADPTRPLSETIEGKLSQKKIVTTAAAGYSSYGNQIGLATGQVDELYHPGYVAKRMEIGAVIAAAPEENVRREKPSPGDKVILLGGRTGRDGCGGATGSSKSHSVTSLETCGAEVQKGNAPEERKLQRLFRNKEASQMIKRCNDFGAGGVSVAIGELADGLLINLDMVPKKYDGLDGTELAISESQERMAVVVAPEDADAFCVLASAENLEATVVAEVTEAARLVMYWRGNKIVDLSREFLDSNGAEKHICVAVDKPLQYNKEIPDDFTAGYRALAGDLNVCSKKGLSERFDSTIGAGTVLMPFGGKNQTTPIQAMVHTISTESGHTDTVSLMAWGYNPMIAEKSPYHASYLAVVESVSKMIAAGASFEEVYLTFQEYFEKPKADPSRWGKPAAALLGALRAQRELSIASIGGKDSMSGTFDDIDVPPTLVSFAVTTDKAQNIISPEFKASGNTVICIFTKCGADGLPEADSLISNFSLVNGLISSKKAVSAYTPAYGGIAEAVMKMSFGNDIGFRFADDIGNDVLFGYNYGAFILELSEEVEVPGAVVLGHTCEEKKIGRGSECIDIDTLYGIYENKLENVFPTRPHGYSAEKAPVIEYHSEKRAYSSEKFASPRVLIPVFPGTNCEYDTVKALRDAGASPEVFVIKNLSASDIADSVKEFSRKLSESNIVFIPGGFSGGDEPDGSGKFITAFFRNGAVSDEVQKLLEVRDGLMCGICNGFQALIKLGLVPYGKITSPDAVSPTLTYNTIGRHQSGIVRTRVASNKSPWLMEAEVGGIYNVPISHGEGRFIADEKTVASLIENGQIATQYVDMDGCPTYDIRYNPNGSVYAIEGITSPDGRVLGKMGHSERIGEHLYKNVPGNYDIGIFRSAVKYFK